MLQSDTIYLYCSELGLNIYILGFVDFKMTAIENALTQPKFDLGICGIIQYVFQGD